VSERVVDLQLCGFCSIDLEGALSGLKALDEEFHLARLVTWGVHGRANTTICDPGASISDFDGVLEYDFAGIRRFDADFAVRSGGAPARLVVTPVAEGGVEIHGQWPVPGDESADSACAAYAEFALASAACLRAELLLVLAGAPRDEVLADEEILSRCLLVVLPDHQVDGQAREELTRAGAALDGPMNGLARVRLQSEHSFMLGLAPSRAVVEQMERVLQRMTASIAANDEL
jgi:hypothetical protein